MAVTAVGIVCSRRKSLPQPSLAAATPHRVCAVVRPGLRMHLARRLPWVLAYAVAITSVAVLAGAAFADREPLLGTEAPSTVPSVIESETGLIVTVLPESVSCATNANFEDVPGGDPPGVNYDFPVWSNGTLFAERFLGQSVSSFGDYDVISGTPTNPLTPQEGAAGQNVNVFNYVSNVLTGLGHLGFADIDAIGEGSIAVYFPTSQARIALDLVGGNGGSATLSFYRTDGTLIDIVQVTGLGEFRYGFATGDLSNSIAGILIQTTDPSGVGIDNVCHEGTVVPARALSWGSLKTRYR